MEENLHRHQEQETVKPEESSPRPDAWKRDIYDWLQMMIVAVLAVVVLFTFCVMLIGVKGSSMYPTLHEGDVMVMQRLGYTLETGDIIIIRKESFSSDNLVKRVIATGGQTVSIDYDANTVTVDGVVLDETYINREESDPMRLEGKETMLDPNYVNTTFTVPEGYLFVMGDNRNNSTDSRARNLGLIDIREVSGKVIWVLMPFSRFGSPY